MTRTDVTTSPVSGTNGQALDRVLVVDDEDTVRRLFVRVLERAGFEASEAVDGKVALESIARSLPDVVLLDCTMPRVTGLEVVTALRSDPRTATLPVILVTGQGEIDDRVAGLAAGADDFVTKPVHPDELVARVRAQLRGQSAWHDTMERQWRSRSELADALTRIPPATTAEVMADAVCSVLTGRSDVDRVSVIGCVGEEAVVLALRSVPGLVAGGLLAPDAAAALRSRAQAGPWSDDTTMHSLGATSVGPAAFAPLWSHDRLIGVLAMASEPVFSERAPAALGSILATAVDLAPIVASVLEPTVQRRTDDARKSALERVIANREFSVHFQPVVQLEHLSVVGYEALTRFDDGTPPTTRFAEAGRLGLRPKLEAVTFVAAIEAAQALPAESWLSVNASARLLVLPEIQQAVARVGRRVVVEVTEHERVDDYQGVNAALERFEPGTQLAVDDAGAGYASLRHILMLHPDLIKLDREWVEAIEDDAARQALVAGLHHFAGSLGAQLVAEGIETDSELVTLRRIGVELGQGYLFARPAPASEFG